MSTTTTIIAAHSTSGVQPLLGPTPTAGNQPPPIVHILSLLSASFSLIFRVFSYFTYTLLSLLHFSFLSPVSFLFKPLLYILSPLTTLIAIIGDTFVFIPYEIIVGVAGWVYPLYVFVGVACLVGAVVGFGGRVVGGGLVSGFLEATRRAPKRLPRIQSESQVRGTSLEGERGEGVKMEKEEQAEGGGRQMWRRPMPVGKGKKRVR
ncbi:hypothetical protein JAAARDRAFT_39658 [Jaapia argillacea MUCL 33604]|uniref:Uncharacterized protein n=1 Tax=Jaapia argillacea MUCL 33604 TaxID=933084 RepID=A0A067PRJ8_9AGAM|nr:hypothetical protein JAAARDRAFT_39658 [Jaapia argillacea MUCL 33604]